MDCFSLLLFFFFYSSIVSKFDILVSWHPLSRNVSQSDCSQMPSELKRIETGISELACYFLTVFSGFLQFLSVKLTNKRRSWCGGLWAVVSPGNKPTPSAVKTAVSLGLLADQRTPGPSALPQLESLWKQRVAERKQQQTGKELKRSACLLGRLQLIKYCIRTVRSRGNQSWVE